MAKIVNRHAQDDYAKAEGCFARICCELVKDDSQ